MTKPKQRVPWSAAQWRHRNPTRVRKMVTTVVGDDTKNFIKGNPLNWGTWLRGGRAECRVPCGSRAEKQTCRDCGYHACSCAPLAYEPPVTASSATGQAPANPFGHGYDMRWLTPMPQLKALLEDQARASERLQADMQPETPATDFGSAVQSVIDGAGAPFGPTADFFDEVAKAAGVSDHQEDTWLSRDCMWCAARRPHKRSECRSE